MDRHHSGGRPGIRRRARTDNEGLFDWNLDSDRIHFSPQWLALIGCDDHELGGQPDDWFQRVHPDDSAELLREIESARLGESTTFACRYRLRQKDGTFRWMDCRGTVVRDRAGRAIRLTGSQSDVTVEMVSDPLTGLPNRLLLIERVTHSIARAKRHKGFHFAVLVIDLGRPAGPVRPSGTTKDPLLTAVARRLETCLRNSGIMAALGHNDLVARLDGDYFGILLEGLKETTDAKVAADHILGEMLQPVPVGGREVRLSASIGVAVSATGYSAADEMLHDAHVAQHRARMLGGSHCEVFDTAILKSEQAELALENDFGPALQRREFMLLFQPIVSLVSNEIAGFEALVRWQHPVLGMLSPDDFIPLAEKTGFIVPLGTWIVREACRHLRAWDADLSESRDLSVSVNVSVAQMRDPGLVDQIAGALRDSGLEPRRLVLELTEGIAAANPAAIITLLMQLRALGVRISIDDFGTGYSSLAYLRQFPIDTLKIDRSFVRNMVTNKDTAEIVAVVMNMAHQLGLHVVAEGIEHASQCEPLRALNCDAGQGHFFGAPMNAEAAAELLRTGLPPHLSAAAQTDRSVGQFLRHAMPLALNTRVALTLAAVALLVVAGLVAAGNVAAARGGPRPPVDDDHPQTPMATRSAPDILLLPTPQPLPDAPVSASQATPPVKAPSRPTPPTAPSTTAPSPRPSGKTTSTPPTTSASTGIASASPVVTPAERTRSTSLKVVHLHRLGSCRGRLDVTRDGVAFASETDGENEAFTLKYTEFIDAVSDDTLVLRSATRTYRFKAASRLDDKVRLRELADTIAHSRR